MKSKVSTFKEGIQKKNKTPKRIYKKKPCQFCNNPQFPQNIKYHEKVCELKTKKLRENVVKNSIVSEITKSQTEQDLTEQLLLARKRHLAYVEEMSQILGLKGTTIEEDQETILRKIREFHVEPQTKSAYEGEWGMFIKFLNKDPKNPIRISKESANTYLASLKVEGTTLQRKIGTIERIMRECCDMPNIRLNKCRNVAPKRLKYPFPDAELNKYLDEQLELDMQDYIVQMLMAKYGLRVNSTAHLTVKDIDFKKQEITFTDTKRKKGKYRTEVAEEDTLDLLKIFIKERGLKKKSFVFYPEETQRRPKFMGEVVNTRFRDSEVIIKDEKFA